MKVRCIANHIRDVKNPKQVERLGKSIRLTEGDCTIEVGIVYSVQAIRNWNGYIYYDLHSVKDRRYPTPYPAEFFEVIDHSIPVHWVVSFKEVDGAVQINRITFPEWANNDEFYERLIDADERRFADDELIEKTYLENMVKD